MVPISSKFTSENVVGSPRIARLVRSNMLHHTVDKYVGNFTLQTKALSLTKIGWTVKICLTCSIFKLSHAGCYHRVRWWHTRRSTTQTPTQLWL
jgi:hypothetical protein